jgi:hypothetical protein
MGELIRFSIPDAIRLDGDEWGVHYDLTVAQWREAFKG